jgi:hypothetical protein
VITSTTVAAPDDTKTPFGGLAQATVTNKTLLIVNQDWEKIFPTFSIIKCNLPKPSFSLKSQYQPTTEPSLTPDQVRFKSTSRPTGWVLHH